MMKRKTRRFQPGRGALVMIASILILSAGLRVSDGAGQALALAKEKVDVTPLAQASAAACETPDDIKRILDAIKDREQTLQKREVALRDRMKALSVAERETEKKLQALLEAEDNLRQTIAMAESASETDLDRLTKVYESMKPKQAAALFEEMDPNFAAGFLGRMRPEAAAEIMAGLTPQSAHTFSVVLAGRHANVPTE
jgi:flagellar motility protein MotE (MotC chaperone)